MLSAALLLVTADKLESEGHQDWAVRLSLELLLI